MFGNQEKSFSEELEELGYFKYSPIEAIESLKKKVDKNYNQFKILSTPKDGKSRPIDLRFYFCDGESVHEENGYKEYVEYIRPTLKKLNIYDEVNAVIPTSSNTSIHVDSVYNLIKHLNQILDSNQIGENWYPVYGGNDGQLILLTPEQFKFLRESIKDAKSRPFEIEAWRKLVVFDKSGNSNTDNQVGKKVAQGNRIDHAKYGHGIIKEINSKGVAIIDFEGIGERKIIMKYAKYDILD